MNFAYTLGRRNTFGTGIVSGSLGSNLIAVITNTKRGKIGGAHNIKGSFGDGTRIGNVTPRGININFSRFVKIDVTAGNFVMALDQNGNLWTWGWNPNGNLGNNSFNHSLIPNKVCGSSKTFCKIAPAGKTPVEQNTFLYAHAIDHKGGVWGWGYNGNGRLGNISGEVRILTPIQVSGVVKTFCEISAGYDWAIALDKNGLPWGWGSKTFAGISNVSGWVNSPTQVAGTVKTFCKISSSEYTNLAIDKNGKVWGWGSNASGQIGNNNTLTQYSPVSVAGANKTFCKISSGMYHSLAIDKNGKVWGWGSNVFGQLGNNSLQSFGTLDFIKTPVQIAGTTKTFCEIFASTGGGINSTAFGTSMGIDKNGNVWSWGMNPSYNNNLYIPSYIGGTIKTFCNIVASIYSSVGIDKVGKSWAWGTDVNGVMATSGSSSFTPISLCGTAKTFCKIDIGVYQGAAIDKNGRGWAWGYAPPTTLPDTRISTPVSISGTIKTFCKIVVGYLGGAAIDKNGKIFTWGENSSGQLGNNSTTYIKTPVSICGTAKTFCEIASLGYSRVALDKNGQAWGWGNNIWGQLGNNSSTDFCTPVSVCGTKKTFCKIYAHNCANGTFDSNVHVFAIDKNGNPWAWGFNAIKLGNNAAGAQSTPVRICGTTKTFCKISSGELHVLALDNYGKVWGWGNNTNHGLSYELVGNRLDANGNPSGEFEIIYTPMRINLCNKTFCDISAGGGYNLAIDSNGRGWSWGFAWQRQGGTEFYSKTPIQIF